MPLRLPRRRSLQALPSRRRLSPTASTSIPESKGENLMNTSTSIALSATNIHKSFGDAHVLKGISLDAHEGDVISILGASGSGKSTFLRCINLLETPDDGVVTVAGETIKMRVVRGGRK